MQPEPSDDELEAMCNDIGADFPDTWKYDAVEGTVTLIRTRCRLQSSQPTANLITAQNNISKWYEMQEGPEKELHLHAYEYIMAKLGKALKKRPSLSNL